MSDLVRLRDRSVRSLPNKEAFTKSAEMLFDAHARSFAALGNLAPELRDRFADKHLVPNLSLNLYLHLLHAWLNELFPIIRPGPGFPYGGARLLGNVENL